MGGLVSLGRYFNFIFTAFLMACILFINIPLFENLIFVMRLLHNGR